MICHGWKRSAQTRFQGVWTNLELDCRQDPKIDGARTQSSVEPTYPQDAGPSSAAGPDAPEGEEKDTISLGTKVIVSARM